MRALLVLVPVVAAAAFAYWGARHDQETRAELFATVILDQAVKTTEQIRDGVVQLKTLGSPCSPQSVALMRRLDLGSSLLQGFGYVEGDVLSCSSIFESQPLTVAAPDYVSAVGYQIRIDRTLSFAPDAPLLLVTAPSGYTALIHPDLVFAMTSESVDGTFGLVSASTRQRMIHRGDYQIDWSKAPIGEHETSGQFLTDTALVVWKRASPWDYVSFAALPLAAFQAELAQLLVPAIGIGLAIGLLLAWGQVRLRRSRTSLPAMLRAGLRSGEISLVYQPLVDMQSGEVIGAEALARWERGGGETVSPDIFVPIAEKHDLIAQLTEHVIARGIAEFAPLLRARPELFLSLNISSRDLEHPGLYDQLANACRQHAVAPDRIHLEITERERVDSNAGATAIATLRGRGFHVGTDDFGVGYSNLHYFDALDLDFIKIDRALLANAFATDGRRDLVEHIIDLARSRGIEVIAEGVELDDQRDALLALGVTKGQGWLYHRAMSAADFSHLLATRARQGSGGPSAGLGTPADDKTRRAA